MYGLYIVYMVENQFVKSKSNTIWWTDGAKSKLLCFWRVCPPRVLEGVAVNCLTATGILAIRP